MVSLESSGDGERGKWKMRNANTVNPVRVGALERQTNCRTFRRRYEEAA
jgi:hypothetical protein